MTAVEKGIIHPAVAGTFTPIALVGLEDCPGSARQASVPQVSVKPTPAVIPGLQCCYRLSPHGVPGLSVSLAVECADTPHALHERVGGNLYTAAIWAAIALCEG